jgi:hypothetical protein
MSPPNQFLSSRYMDFRVWHLSSSAVLVKHSHHELSFWLLTSQFFVVFKLEFTSFLWGNSVASHVLSSCSESIIDFSCLFHFYKLSKLSFLRVSFPTTFPDISSYLYQVCLAWLHPSSGFLNLLTFSLRLYPLGLISYRIRPWDSAFRGFPLPVTATDFSALYPACLNFA